MEDFNINELISNYTKKVNGDNLNLQIISETKKLLNDTEEIEKAFNECWNGYERFKYINNLKRSIGVVKDTLDQYENIYYEHSKNNNEVINNMDDDILPLQ